MGRVLQIKRSGRRSKASDGGRPSFIDAFAGCGGLTLGLMRAGWNGQFAIEKDRFAFDILHENFLKQGTRYSYSWPDWLEPEPWSVEKLQGDTHSNYGGCGVELIFSQAGLLAKASQARAVGARSIP